MALRFQITKLKFRQYLLRANSPNLMLAKLSHYTVYILCHSALLFTRHACGPFHLDIAIGIILHVPGLETAHFWGALGVALVTEQFSIKHPVYWSLITKQ